MGVVNERLAGLRRLLRRKHSERVRRMLARHVAPVRDCPRCGIVRRMTSPELPPALSEAPPLPVEEVLTPPPLATFWRSRDAAHLPDVNPADEEAIEELDAHLADLLRQDED